MCFVALMIVLLLIGHTQKLKKFLYI